jgi:hypothetical protein
MIPAFNARRELLVPTSQSRREILLGAILKTSSKLFVGSETAILRNLYHFERFVEHKHDVSAEIQGLLRKAHRPFAAQGKPFATQGKQECRRNKRYFGAV